uniref:G_PROTEIN_RECEP_F1_2 domain-containing protein n=1 Tax=Haemonchus contortus TaxID=6289 RepID=A0A7I5EDD7_HAECO
MKIALLLSFVYCFVVWIYTFLFVKIVYYPYRFVWNSPYEHGIMNKILSQVDFVVSMFCMSLTFLVHIAMVITICKLSNRRNVRQNERQLLIHATLLFGVLATLIFVYHYSDSIIPNTEWAYVGIEIYWILYCGLNPILYLAFSKSIRRTYLRFVRLAPQKRQNIVTVVAASRY